MIAFNVKNHRSKQSWIRAHIADPFVRQAQAHGYRSRAAFKLIELADRDRLLAPGLLVVDLGAAPGSWAQVVSPRVAPGGRVVAFDTLCIEPIAGVEIIEGDFRALESREKLAKALGGRKVDLVLSDMAPNLTGVASTDEANSLQLCELALEFAVDHLRLGGTLLVKAFQSGGYREFLQTMRGAFRTVASRKPDASRGRSAEMYLLGKGFIGIRSADCARLA
jgi:23S rRNA (uridine2552-2'-O)-methyltransferase